MKKAIFAVLMLALAAVSCQKDEEKTDPLKVDFTLSTNLCHEGDEITLTANVSGGKAPYTYTWEIGQVVKLEGQETKWTSDTKGTYVVKLTATDSKGNSANRSKNLVVEPKEIIPTGEVNLVWTAELSGYTSMTTPAVADDGSIYTVTRDANKIYKISSDGSKVWDKPVLVNPIEGSQVLGTPSIDNDGTIYICGGTKNGDGVVVAFNPDGTEKWRFKDFFAKEGSTPAPSINGIIAGIGDKNIYVGNTGTTGSMLSISKTDGTRVNYMKSEDGGGPSGGVRAGILISKDGYACWSGGAYGIFGVSLNVLDSPGEGASWGWRTMYSAEIGWPDGNANATLAAMELNGKNVLVGQMSDKTPRTKVYAIDFVTGEVVSQVAIDECAKQDQGGVVITGDGLVVATLKYTLGSDDGGIALVDLVQNKMVAHYRVAENVAGAPAIDASGKIYFATESGNFYVVEPKGDSFETLVKINIADLVRNDERYADTFKELYAAKIWSGIVIGDDGVIYVQFTENETRAQGGLAAITVDYCTGPSTTSPWPMMGQNRKHTNRQK